MSIPVGCHRVQLYGKVILHPFGASSRCAKRVLREPCSDVRFGSLAAFYSNPPGHAKGATSPGISHSPVSNREQSETFLKLSSFDEKPVGAIGLIRLRRAMIRPGRSVIRTVACLFSHDFHRNDADLNPQSQPRPCLASIMPVLALYRISQLVRESIKTLRGRKSHLCF